MSVTDSHDAKSLKQRMATGALWSVAFVPVNRGLGIISTLILVRLLVPDDFGVVGMCAALIAGLQVLTAFGFDMVLIQKQDTKAVHYDTVFTLNLLMRLAVCLLILVAASFVANELYGDPRVYAPLCLLAISFLAGGMQSVRLVDLRKSLRFKQETFFRSCVRVVGFVVTIPLALVLGDYRALVAGMIAMEVAGVAGSYLVAPYRPRLSLRETRAIMTFSIWLFLSNVANFFTQRFAPLVLGAQVGAAPLGIWEVSRDVSYGVTSPLNASVNRAVYPGYAKMSGDVHRLTQTYTELFGLVSLWMMPVCIGIALVAEPLVAVALGEAWLEAVPVVRIMALFGLLASLNSNSSYVFVAVGKPQINTYMGLFRAALFIPALLFLVDAWGLLGAAYAMLASEVVMTLVRLVALKRIVQLDLTELIERSWPVPAAASVMSACVLLGFERGPDAAFPKLVFLSALGAVAYVACVAFASSTRRSEAYPERVMVRYLVASATRLLKRA